jgi:hypothetical protein
MPKSVPDPEFGVGRDPEFDRALGRAPKVELHVHLDGAMSHPWLLERVRRRPAAGVTTLEAPPEHQTPGPGPDFGVRLVAVRNVKLGA